MSDAATSQPAYDSTPSALARGLRASVTSPAVAKTTSAWRTEAR
jgi:hypothetical protein